MTGISSNSLNHIARVLKEVGDRRIDQIGKHEYTPDHDDNHPVHELVEAGVAFALVGMNDPGNANHYWPWEGGFSEARDVPPEKRRDYLIDAAAMIVASIEHIDRNSGK